MKALTFFLSLLIVVGVNYEASAQYSRNSNNGGGGYTASANSNSRNSSDYYRSSNRNATRSERRRFQNDLVRYADRLDNLEYNLQFRSDALDGRGIRNSRRFRSNRPNGLLTIRELRNWEVRLDRRANRLRNWERDLLRAERRRGNNRRGTRGGNRGNNRNNGGNRGGGGNGGGGYCPPGWG